MEHADLASCMADDTAVAVGNCAAFATNTSGMRSDSSEFVTCGKYGTEPHHAATKWLRENEMRLALMRIVRKRFCAMFGAREKEAEVDSTIILAATAGAFLLAGFVKGVIGLGLPTVSHRLARAVDGPDAGSRNLGGAVARHKHGQAVVGGGLIALAPGCGR